MRVGLSLLTLVPGISGGSETYARELARALARGGEHDYEALVPTLAPEAAGGLPSVVATGYRASRTIPGRLRAMASAALLPGEAGRRLDGCDVVHFPLTVPVPRTRQPRVITLLDLQHLDLPHLFTRGERLFRRLAYDRAAQNADRVVTISAFVRERIVDRLSVAPDRIDVIHLGVDHGRFAPDPTVEREPFLLYPARPWPHKNHGRLFEAFAELRRRRPELELVLTGYDWTVPAGVRALGHVGPEELAGLYRRAGALVFPSLYEGFGLPPLEAMASGCPVACSNAASLREVCGGGARYFDPRDVNDIVAAVEDVLADADGWSARGIDRAAGFSWHETARAHDEVYRALASA